MRIPRKKAVGIVILLIGILVITGYALAAYYVRISGSVAHEITISLTDKGFEPDSVIVLENTRVSWVNVGKQLHWPASDSHPTHTNYPSERAGCIGSTLDACRGLAPGESYTFTFDTIGTWGIHDHLFPGLFMTVRVVEPGSQLTTAPPIDAPIPSREEFLALDSSAQTQILQRLAHAEPQKAWKYVKQAFIVDGNVVSNAHTFAHLVGNEIYRTSGLAGITTCDDSFAYGCYHGVTEAMLLAVGMEQVPDIEKNCLSTLKNEHSENYTGCIHGIGHGLLSWSGLQMTKALAGCDLLQEQYRGYCYDGVFMEHAEASPKNVFDKDHPWQLCDGLEERYRYNCARYQSLIFTNAFGWSFGTSADVCSQADDRRIREACLSTIGYMVAQQEQTNIDNIKTRCNELYKEEGYAVCIMSAADEIRFQRYEHSEHVAASLCESLSSPWRENCGHSVEASPF
jgi:plastocyanin